MVFVRGGAEDEVERGGEEQWEEASVGNVECDRDSLDLGMGEGDGEVVDVEEAVERGREEGEEGVECREDGKT